MAQPLYTELAGRAIELSKLFALFVANPAIPTDGGVFAIELMTPHGPSTGGGAQPLQHIRFVHGDLTVVAGSLDQTRTAIVLRGYAHLDELYRRRHRKPLPFTRASHDLFLQRVRAFAKSQSYTIAIEEVAPPELATANRRWPALVALIALIALVAAIAAAVLALR